MFNKEKLTSFCWVFEFNDVVKFIHIRTTGGVGNDSDVQIMLFTLETYA